MDSLKSFFASALLLLFLLSKLQFTSPEKLTGFSLNFIHRDSPVSPLYPGALTLQEKVERYKKMSRSRASHLMSMRMQNGTLQLQGNNQYLDMSVSDYSYLVQVRIGDPVKTYSLSFDTGSELVWIQCQPCEECSGQKHLIYDPNASKTFRKVPVDDPACNSFIREGNHCSYDIHYYDESSTQGYAAWERLIISSPGRKVSNLDKILFGCSARSKLNHKNDNPDGFFGMNRKPVSFISQLMEEAYSINQFSYCLVDPVMKNPPMSYLKFGMDSGGGGSGSQYQTTPLVENPDHHYMLNLIDISVNNKRLNFPPGTFAPKPRGKGGFIADTGSVFTVIDEKAYKKLEAEFVRYFSAFKSLERRRPCKDGSMTDLCYNAPSDFQAFPTMTYHLQGADLKLPPENLFIFDRRNEYFYLIITPMQDISILGSFQQQNINFVYKPKANQLSFAPVDCAQVKP